MYPIAMTNPYISSATSAGTHRSKTAAFFVLGISLLSPGTIFAAGSAYEALSSRADVTAIPVPAVPQTAPSAKAGKMNFGRNLAILALSDDALAAASPDQKVEMLKKLISSSRPDTGNSDDSFQDQDQKDLRQGIERILASAPDAASFDRVYYRLDLGRLYSAVGYYSPIRALVEKHRASTAPGDWEGLRRYVDYVTETASSGRNYIKFLIDGRDLIPEASRALKAAKTHIHIEIFHLQADNIGWGLARLLGEKARAGVNVRLLLDEHGSKTDSEPEVMKLISFLRESGAVVRTKKLSLTRDHLDHRKVVVIDGTVAFTGGMNIGRSYQVDWHDQQTLVIGPAVAKLQESFIERWKNAGGGVSAGENLFPALEEYPGGAETQVVGHIGLRDQNLKAVYLRAIGTAQKSIRIANPYFTDGDVVNALRRAAERGVKVQLVLPQDNNVSIVQHASRRSYPKLLKAGVEIYEYKGRMAHEKVAVIDGRWATFGSSNLDARSLLNNDELNLIVTDPGVAADIETRLFEADLRSSERITEYSPDLLDHIAHQFSGLL